MIAHEYNNVMSPLVTRAEFALAGNRPEDLRKALEVASRQAQRAVEISKQLRAFIEPPADPGKPVNLAEAAQEAIATLIRPLDKDGVDLILKIPSDLQLLADRNMLVHLVLNLILNARQAMLESRGYLRVSATEDGPYALLQVCDSGVGLAPERLEAFNRFFQAPDESVMADGVGLGLLVCRTIVRRFGGSIETTRNESRGCTFSVRWPLA